jgi:Flp pilus assembly pilin Flp
MSESREVAPLQHNGGALREAGEGTMNSLLHKLYLATQSFIERQAGQGLTEYAMAVSVIAFGTVAGQSAIAEKVNHTFIAITSTITTGIGL